MYCYNLSCGAVSPSFAGVSLDNLGASFLTGGFMSGSVIDYLQYDFKRKNDILSVNFDVVSPETFYETLFSDLSLYDDTCIVVYGSDKNLEHVTRNPIQSSRRVMSLFDMINSSKDYANMYVAPATFFNGVNKSKSLKNLYAIVVDFDGDNNGVSIDVLQWLIDRITENNDNLPAPSFVTNSGKGLHLFWVFSEPVAMFTQNKFIMNKLYYAIHERLIQFHALPQRHHLAQSYRIVGSKTKLGDVTTAFRTGEVYNVEELLRDFDLQEHKIITRAMIDQANKGNDILLKKVKKPTKKMVDLANSIENSLGVICENKNEFDSVLAFIDKYKSDHTKIISQKNLSKRKTKGGGWGSVQWYTRMKQAIIEYTPEGYRYTSLEAFMVIGYKCNIAFEQVKKDEYDIILRWKMRPSPNNFKEPFNEEYKDRVDNMYSKKYMKVTCKKLEEWLGFPMHSASRRNGRKQKEHLLRVRAAQKASDEANGTNWRENNGRKSVKDRILKWKDENPLGTQVECSKKLNLSISTIKKWWPAKKKEKASDIVRKWRNQNSSGTKYQCIKDTGLSKHTVYKWWDVKEDVNINKESSASNHDSHHEILSKELQESLMLNLVKYVFEGKTADDITDELIKEGKLSNTDRTYILEQVQALLNTFTNLGNIKK